MRRRGSFVTGRGARAPALVLALGLALALVRPLYLERPQPNRQLPLTAPRIPDEKPGQGSMKSEAKHSKA